MQILSHMALEFENCYKQKYLEAESYKIVLITVSLNGNPKPSQPLPGEGLTHTCFSGEGGGGGRFALPWYDVFTNNRQYREDLIIIVNRSPLKQFQMNISDAEFQNDTYNSFFINS